MSLRTLLQQPGILTLPGVYDGISARMADQAGFPALYMTGYGVVASALGVADAGVATYTEMLDRVRMVAGAVSVPFIADGDTGYGGLLNVDRTVRGYAAAGAAGIQIEDQEFPKKCGHTEFRRVIPMSDAVAKIRVAVDARPSNEFLIVARTDARYAHGIDDALRRAERFLAAGADVLFVESPESLEEMRRVAETFRGAACLPTWWRAAARHTCPRPSWRRWASRSPCSPAPASWPPPPRSKPPTPTCSTPAPPRAARPCSRSPR